MENPTGVAQAPLFEEKVPCLIVVLEDKYNNDDDRYELELVRDDVTFDGGKSVVYLTRKEMDQLREYNDNNGVRYKVYPIFTPTRRSLEDLLALAAAHEVREIARRQREAEAAEARKAQAELNAKRIEVENARRILAKHGVATAWNVGHRQPLHRTLFG